MQLREFSVKPQMPAHRYAAAGITPDIQMVHASEVAADSSGFVAWLDDCFDALEMDRYDVLLEVERLLEAQEPVLYRKHVAEWAALWDKQQASPEFWIEKLNNAAVAQEINRLRPFRQRGCFNYNCQRSATGHWLVQENGNPIFKQDVEDIRSRPRQYSAIPQAYRWHNDWLRLVAWVAELVYQRPIQNPRLSVTAHFMRTYAKPKKKLNPAPEGIHRDGANYIMSGLVVARKNVRGGRSTVYLMDKKTVVFQRELQEGEGIFQSDEENLYWHSVSDLELLDEGKLGYRSIVGFDVVVKNF